MSKKGKMHSLSHFVYYCVFSVDSPAVSSIWRKTPVMIT